MVKLINQRRYGSLFHYAHFMCDCVLPEIINDINTHDVVYRIKNLNQTLGNFASVYEQIFGIKSIELPEEEFNKLDDKIMIIKGHNSRITKNDFNKFRNYMFNKFNVNPLVYDPNYPEVLLIERGGRIELIDDEELKKNNTNVSTGKERREIKDIDKLKDFLSVKYQAKYKCIMLEGMSLEEQIKYFNNAKLIILAHGAAMSNMMFCKPNTHIVEVTCDKVFGFFDVISTKLNLYHHKCHNNNLKAIVGQLKCFEVN